MMEKQSSVVFRNVGQLYFPQSRVECHYSLTSKHNWSNRDWIGLFKVGWSSVKEYHTYTWALATENYTEGDSVNCCVHFPACYLPRPCTAHYQFVYVDETGEVCGSSRHFTFCAPKPLDELETLEEERDEDDEDGEEQDLLLVIPRAQLLQSQLEVGLKERAELKQALEMAVKEKEKEKENWNEAVEKLEQEKKPLADEITELRENLRASLERLEVLQGKQKDVQCNQESLSTELSSLVAVKTESQQRIRELEDEVTALTGRGRETEAELERMKERVKKMSDQRKDEEARRKNLQMENEAALAEARGLRDRLEASERMAEGLRVELSELAGQQGHTHAEVHQARLQAAQLTLQLSEEHLAHREGRASWAHDRVAFKQAAEIDEERLHKLTLEVQRKEEWLQEERMERENLEAELEREKDCNRVHLGDARKELQELKASLKKIQKERQLEQLEKQDLMDVTRQLERRLEAVSDSKWSEAALNSINHGSFSEEEKSAPQLSTTPEVESSIFDSKNGQDLSLILPDVENSILSELAESW